MALREQGASQGKPFFITQALGIPLLACVFLLLRILLLSRLSSGQINVELSLPVLVCFKHLQLSDFLLVSCCIWVYTIDFFKDLLQWDEQGFSLRSWQVLWILFWGLLPFFGLLLVAPIKYWFLKDGFDFTVVIGAFQWAIFGGLGYLFVQRLGGKFAALFGPICIAFAFICALFWDVESPFQMAIWWQGFLVFLLNVLLMQWFEQDKDSVSNSTNIWLSFNVRILLVIAVLIVVTLLIIFSMQASLSWGLPALLLFYVLLMIFPDWVRYFRFYRLLTDGILVIWLL